MNVEPTKDGLMLLRCLGRAGRCASFLLWASVVSPEVASAATYWVSATGQAAWAACRGDLPLDGPHACSIRTANTNAAPGDTVLLRGATYRGDVFIAPRNSGAMGYPITYSAYGQEQVLVNSQRVPNSGHESQAWASWNGATTEHSRSKASDGDYSTRFGATASGQGVRSDAFALVAELPGLGYYYTFRVYSDQTSVNVQVRSVDGSVLALNQDYLVTPNQWNTFGGYMLTSSSKPFYVVVASSKSAPAGTWHVDGVRINAYIAAISINSVDHIVVRGIDVSAGVKGLDIRDGAEYNEISHSSFTDMGHKLFINNQIWDGNGLPSSYNWIHDSVFHDSGWVQRGSGGTTDCDDVQSLFVVGNNNGTDESNFNLIERNEFYHGGHDLVIIRTRFNTFRNNILHNEGWMLNREGPCQDVDGDPTTFNNPPRFGNRALLFENARNAGGTNLVEGNRIGFSGTPPDDDGANAIENPSDGNIVRYNFLFKNGGAGFYFKAQPGISGVDVLPDHNRVYNNTIYANGGGADIAAARSAGLYLICGALYTPTHPTGNVLKNNIVFGNTVPVRGGACEGYSYVDNFEEDPQFVNLDLSDPFSSVLPNLSLRAGSPAIDAAAALTTVKTGDAGKGTSLAVEDARYFQDGSWGPPGRVQPDVIAVGTPTNRATVIAVDYLRNILVLSMALNRQPGDRVWLSRKSDGASVLAGAGPDFGASEFGALLPPANLRIVR